MVDDVNKFRAQRGVRPKKREKTPRRKTPSSSERDSSDRKKNQKKHKDFPILPYLLVEMMQTQPKSTSKEVKEKWKELGPIDLTQMVHHLPAYTSSQNFGRSQQNEDLWGLLDKGDPTVISGIGRHVFQSGNLYEGMYRNDKRDGYGRLMWNDGAYYTGNWKKDKRNGQGCFYHANGDMEQGEWKEGKLI